MAFIHSYLSSHHNDGDDFNNAFGDDTWYAAAILVFELIDDGGEGDLILRCSTLFRVQKDVENIEK